VDGWEIHQLIGALSDDFLGVLTIFYPSVQAAQAPQSHLEDQALALARWKDQKQGSRASDKTWTR
jgi:hypothetical protein